MRIEQTDKGTCVIHSDDGVSIAWNVSVFERTRYSGVDDVFRDINSYWAYLTPARRLRIWRIYENIRNTLDNYNSIEEAMTLKALTASLVASVEALYIEMPLSELEQWLRLYGKVVYPATGLRKVHDPDDPMPDRTYLVADYQGLVLLTTALRPMVPIWGEYIRLIKQGTGSLYKEYIAMRLLDRSTIVLSPMLERLRRYIECSITRETDTSAAVIAGLGRSEIPEWLLAIVTVRRMSVGEVDASDESGSIITNIYGFVTSTLNDLNKKFGGIKEKYPEDNASNADEGGGSMLESYRPRQRVSSGDTTLFNVAIGDIENHVLQTDPTVPSHLIQMCAQNIKHLSSLNITKHHMDMVKWVLADVISPRAVQSLYQEPLLCALAATQALLLHWGFNELALWVTSEGRQPNEHNMASLGAKMRVPPELIERLNYFYPYVFNSHVNGGKKPSQVYTDIITLAQNILTNHWYSTNIDAVVKHTGITLDASRRLKPSPTLAENLATLVVFINQRKEPTP